MEYLFFAVILYFVLQAASNIVFMMRGGGASEPSANGQADEPLHDWRGPSPREHTGSERAQPTFWNDVEDATWHDVSHDT